jgi:TRAP-type C4-dicarboxylate transport system permease small subunit
MRFIDRIAYALSTGGATILVFLMSALVTFDILIRALTGRGLIWALDLASILLVIYFFAILPWSLRSDAHVRMDIFYPRMKASWRAASDFIGAIGAAIFFGSIAWRAIHEAPRMAEFGVSSPTVGIPYWPVVTFVGACCVLAIAVLVASLVSRRNEGSGK